MPVYNLDEGLRVIDEQYEHDLAQANARPRVSVLDKDLELVGDVWDEDDGSREVICNDAGEAWVTIPAEDAIAQWLIDQPKDADIFLVFESEHEHECYKVFDIELDNDENGITAVRPVALHILDETKHIQCWPNPRRTILVQTPKTDVRFGNAIQVIKSFAHMNLLREQHFGWNPSFDIWNAPNWQANFDNDKWPMVMIPYIAERDGVAEWTALGSKMNNLYDLVKPTLEDAGLQMTAKLWRRGDPQPCPTHFTLTRPTIVFDVVRRSVAAGITGTILDPIRDLVRIIQPDGTSETVTIADPNNNPNHGNDDDPYIIFRKGQYLGLRSKMTIHKPIEHTITTGGKSPDAINSGAKLISNILLGIVGGIIGLPWLTLGIFDKAVEDVVLAWAIFTDYERKAAMGRYSHKSGFESGGGAAVSPSGLQTGRVGLHKARGYVSFAADFDDGSGGYYMGRHIEIGIRCGFEIGDRIWLSNIASGKQAWDRTTAPFWAFSVGDYRAAEPNGTKALRHIETMTGALRQISSAT